MEAKRLYLIMLLVLTACWQAGFAQDNPSLPPAAPVSELDPQLKLTKDALLDKGSSDQMRINAASVLLSHPSASARKILLDTLKQTDNPPARAAVCRALIQTRTLQKPLENKEEFAQPLLEILITDDSAGAKLAAEATLIFKYEQIQKILEGMVSDVSLPAKARLNAIYTLRLHPDMGAIFKLLTLLEDPNEQIVAATQSALNSLGILADKDAESRKKIIADLKAQGAETFLRDRLINREAEIRRLENKFNVWQERYLSALDKIHDAITDDAAKGKFLAEQLSGSEPMLKLWALEKITQRRTGTNPKLPVELGPVLVNLISDQDRNVRLKTAKILALMGELDSAQQLLEQLKTEQDDEVRIELFVALGKACYFASLPDAKFKISADVKKQTLEWAVKYLSEQDPQKVRKGAEVIRRLLEQNGLKSDEVERYFVLLTERFDQLGNIADSALRGELLSVMAGLCAPQSVQNAQARKHFRALFEKALSDKTDLVREAAVDGLIYIDKTGALKRLRKDFINDNSIIVRKKLINLAGEVAAKEDLPWLAEKIGSKDESEPAWQAMLKIFNSSDASVLNEWTEVFISQNSQTKFSCEQKIAFLEIAERKALNENKPEILTGIREKLASLYIQSGQFERAADYLGKLYEAAKTKNEKEEILPNLLYVYLRWPKVDAAAKLIENRLLEKDLSPDSVIVHVIDDNLNNPLPGVEPQAVLKILAGIKVPEKRPMWQQQLKQWNDRLNMAVEAEAIKDNSD